jgi:hypothetical protein
MPAESAVTTIGYIKIKAMASAKGIKEIAQKYMKVEHIKRLLRRSCSPSLLGIIARGPNRINTNGSIKLK